LKGFRQGAAMVNEESIFSAAIEKSCLDERAAYLDRACLSNTELRARVQALLDAHDHPDSFLEPSFCVPHRAIETAGVQATIDRSTVEVICAQIGPYMLLEQIGEGGFGVVFLAEQEQPVKRRVALKVIKPGMDTRQVIARFEAERQALAMMDHPNIAKVFDAGATENGRPFFVMELVQGVPITEYCDQCNLTTRERLELFMTVCQAVQHAHQKGVIHRDIKPTNVLVALQDGLPASKIIDFGVAKAINQRFTEHSLMTGFAQVLGTPLYMSPEQADLSPLGVDTRSDIYSLGVLLYELLTSTTPFGKDRLHAAPYDEMRRIIREEEPPTPSVRLSTLAATRALTIAENRRTDHRRLSHQVRGDLDWIVMKAMEKDRNRRYETAAELAADVGRHLNDEPVTAVAPSRIYRASKFVRRNWWPVIAASAVLAGLVASIIGMAIGLISQSRQRAEVQLNLGIALHSQGRFAEADAAYREGLRSANSSSAEDRQRAAHTRLRLASVVYDQGDPIASEKLYREALAEFRAAFPQDDRNIAHALITFALLFRSQQRFDEAEVLFREAYEIQRQVTPVNHRAIGESATHLTNVLTTLGRNGEAEQLAREAIAEQERGVPQDVLGVAFARIERGRALVALHRFPEAEQEILAAEPIITATDHFHVGMLAATALYTAWDQAEPGEGYDAKAKERTLKHVQTFVRPDIFPIATPRSP
jgi:serine/threonine protein kinase